MASEQDQPRAHDIITLRELYTGPAEAHVDEMIATDSDRTVTRMGRLIGHIQPLPQDEASQDAIRAMLFGDRAEEAKALGEDDEAIARLHQEVMTARSAVNAATKQPE
jgi:hypothetical protein